MKRLESIDLLRAVAILLMVQLHFVEYLTPVSSEPSWLRALSRALGTLSLPIFTFLVGMSLPLSLHRQAAGGQPVKAIAWRTFRRALLIFLLGLVFLIVVWGPREVFTWDVLNLIGFSILALYPLRRVRPACLVLIAVLVLLVSPVLRQWIGQWGFLASGYFPIFPWTCFSLVGFALAGMALVERRPAAMRWLPVVGLGLFGVGIGSGLLSSLLSSCDLRLGNVVGWYVAPLAFYPPSTTYLIAVMGFILFSFGLLRLRLDLRPAPRWWMIFFQRYSRFALTTYLMHHALLLWPLRILGSFRRGDPWAFFGRAVHLPVALGLAAAFVVLFYVVLVRWDRSGGRCSLEWLLGKLMN